MKTAQITKLLFIPTGAYHDMAHRPYSIERATDSDLTRLESATQGFRDLTPSAMAGIAGNMLRPTAAPQGTLSIENGWNSRRFMFMMEVVHENDFDQSDTSVRVQYITGWTSHNQLSLQSRLLDPNMMLYIDRIINTRELRHNNMVRRRGVGARYYLAPLNGGSYGNRADSNRWAMRPRDIINSVGNTGFDVDISVDYRNNLATRPVLSNAKNNLASDYLSRAAQGYKQAVNMHDSVQVDTPELMYRAANLTDDDAAVDDVFLSELMRHTELSEGQSMSYGEFCALFPSAHDVAHVAEDTSMLRAQDIGFDTHQPMDSNGWTGTNTVTVAATIASQAVTALMFSALLTQVSFHIGNDTVDGQPIFEWLAAPASFMNTGGTLEHHAEFFRSHMINDVLSDLTMGGNITLDMYVYSDLINADTRMELTVDGGVPTPFAVPNFVGSMITPVVANNRHQVSDLTSSLGQMFKFMNPSQVEIPEPEAFGENFMAGGASLGSVLRERERSHTAAAAPQTIDPKGWNF